MGLRWGMMATLLIEVAYVGPQVRPFTFPIYKKRVAKFTQPAMYMGQSKVRKIGPAYKWSGRGSTRKTRVTLFTFIK